MTNAGNPNPESETPNFILWGIIVFALIFAACMVSVGIQTLPNLFALISPPMPPIPSNTVEKSYEFDDFSRDVWEYTVSQNACDVQAFYLETPATCSELLACDESPQLFPRQTVGACENLETYSNFDMAWTARMIVDADDTQKTRLIITRQIQWK